MSPAEMAFTEHATRTLGKLSHGDAPQAMDAAVLVLLGPDREGRGEPCLILNKRSARVRQAGDLCYPGGRIHSRLDAMGARLLRLPGTPLTRWTHWPRWRRQPSNARCLALLLAAALRESAEEMRLNPWGVRLLGPLPCQSLALYRRRIAPLACWVPRQRRFLPNWEVEKVVWLPLADLLQPQRYACYRLYRYDEPSTPWRDLPCFVLKHGSHREILWGVSFRIAMDLMALLYGFQPPPLDGLPVIERVLEKSYVGQ